MPGDAVDGVRADVFEQVKALHARVHPLAGRQRRAGLSLAVGHRSARRAPDVDQPVLEERARARRLRHRRVHPVRAQRRRGALDHGERRGARRDGGRGRGVGRVLQRPGDLHVRRDARRATAIPSRTASSTGRSATRSGATGCAATRTPSTYARNLDPLRRRDARRRSVDPGDRRRRQRHGVEPHRAPARGRALRLPGDSPLLRPTRHAGRPANLMARPLHYERFYGEMDARICASCRADRRPRLAINEWGLDLPESQQYSILAALYGGAADERLRAARRSRRDERRVRPRERLAGRHHPGQPPWRVRHADLPRQPALRIRGSAPSG